LFFILISAIAGCKDIIFFYLNEILLDKIKNIKLRDYLWNQAMRNILIIGFLGFFGIISCKKDIQFTKDHLNFSKDTVLFDTVFTTVGSTTQRLKIYNWNNQKIKIDEIQLMGGSNSPFRINVDGVPTDYAENVEIAGNDSLFVFVEVTLEVNNTTNPMVISDSIRFRTNGLDQYVNLDVWGQDAYFHVNEIVQGNWANDKPHVLYGVAGVGYPGLDSNLTLTIPAGTEIYCHKGSRLLVYKSTLDIQGSYGNEVVFQGDRLESFYDNTPGQWYGVHFIEANSSTIDYAIIKNGSVGIQVDSTQSAHTLLLTNTIVENNDYFGLNVNAGGVITAENCLFGSAGICSAYLFAGGEYHFNHCNFVNYWNGSRGGPALAVKNYYEYEGTTYIRDVLNSEVMNCVVWGTIDKELEVDTLQFGAFNMDFSFSVIRRNEIYDYAGYTNIDWDSTTHYPGFIDPSIGDFHLMSTSPLIDSGTPTSVISDIEGAARSNPDAGCYEFN
jgi:hypothetical protein